MQTNAMIALSALLLGLALAGSMAAFRSRGSVRARPFLFAIYGLLAGIGSIPLVVVFAAPVYIFYMPAVLPMLFALPPAVHLFAKARASSEPVPLNVWRDAALPGAGLVITLGYWSLSGPAKAAMFVDGVLPPGVMPSALAVLTVGLILLWSIASFGYLIATVRALRAHRAQLKSFYSNTEEYELRWIDALLALLVALWAASALSLVTDNMGSGVLVRGEFVFLLAACVVLVLLAFEGTPEPVLEVEVTPPPAEEQAAPQDKYARSALTSERAQSIAERIEAAMRQDSLYLDANLSLQKLSQHVRTPPNLVSQTLNEKLNTTFFDLVAHWRIEAAKPLIENGEETVLTIALDVGFNSRSTFYKAFKRETGMTPNAFRENSKIASHSSTSG